jgi:GT2 family glycosyltransferase
MPLVSVILPTYNRLNQLKHVLAGLEQQTYPLDQFEVVVVSDGSTDGTSEYLRSIETPLKLKPLFQENQGVAATRNHGVQHAQGEIVLFIDDDVVPTSQLMVEHLRTHEKLGANVVVIGPMLPPPDFRLSAWVQWGQERLGEQYEAMITGQWEATARQFYTGNTSLARGIMLEHGGFDPQFRRAEDVELAYRLHEHGIRFFFCPKAIGYHYEERSFQSWLAIPYAYGRNDVIFTYQKGNAWLLPKIFQEFHTRHSFTRALVSLCLGRPTLIKLVTITMKQMMETSYNLRLPVLPRVACSTLFNLYHYQGIIDELGSPQLFFDGIRGKPIASPYINGK